MEGFKLRLLRDTSIHMDGIEVDSSIYKARSRMVSLRFVYSNKVEKCPLCEDVTERRLACKPCGGKGVALSNFTYVPSFALCSTTGEASVGVFRALHPDFGTLARNHSLWPDPADTREDYAVPDADPVYAAAGTSSGASYSDGRARKAPSAARRQKQHEEITGPALDMVEELVRSLTVDGALRPWKDVTVQSVCKVSQRIAHVSVGGIGSTHCLYAQKNHGSNRIWFKMYVSGELVLQCFSRNKEYPCQTATRVKFHVPSSLTKRVFDLDVLTICKGVEVRPPDSRSFKRRRVSRFIFQQDLQRVQQRGVRTTQADPTRARRGHVPTIP
jgi:hypothetical protein